MSREINGRFAKGHEKVGGFVKGSKHTPVARAKILQAMLDNKNRWLGERAGYHAVHIWLTKHYDKGESCEKCETTTASRLEWANISGKYRREREDYMVLCPSCHRLMDNQKRRELQNVTAI